MLSKAVCAKVTFTDVVLFFYRLVDRVAEDFESNRIEKERKTKEILDFSVSQII